MERVQFERQSYWFHKGRLYSWKFDFKNDSSLLQDYFNTEEMFFLSFMKQYSTELIRFPSVQDIKIHFYIGDRKSKIYAKRENGVLLLEQRLKQWYRSNRQHIFSADLLTVSIIVDEHPIPK